MPFLGRMLVNYGIIGARIMNGGMTAAQLSMREVMPNGHPCGASGCPEVDCDHTEPFAQYQEAVPMDQTKAKQAKNHRMRLRDPNRWFR